MAGASGRKQRAKPAGHPLRAEVVAHHQRQRILSGAKEVIARRGYRNVAVADIVKSAAIARRFFYQHFASKEDCFFALYDEAADTALRAVSEACGSAEEDFPQLVSAGITALIEQIESDRALACACVIEGPAVGQAINPRFEKLIGDFAALLRSGRGGAGANELPETVEETVVGGLYWLLYYALLEERPKRLARLRPHLVEFSLIPFVGAEAAQLAAG